MELPSIKARAAILFIASCLCGGFALHAATGVRLVSGETIDGKVQLNNNQIEVLSQNGNKTFDLANVLDAVFREDRGPVKDGMLPPGVMLTDGTVIAGNVNTLDDPVRVGEASVPLASIAWVIFQPVAFDKSTIPPAGQTGGIMPSGDFFPGTFGGLKDNKLAINSQLFGPQRFSVRGKVDVMALVLRDVQPGAGRYEVVVRGGSIYQVNDIKTDKDNVMLYDPVVGSVKIHNDNLLEIRLSRNQFLYLTGLKPDHVEVGKGGDAATAVQTPQNPGDAGIGILQTSANTAVSYMVPKGFTVFSSGAMVSQGAPAGIHYTFAVYGDGKFLLTRSNPIAAGENAQKLTVPIANVHFITIRVEAASPGGDAGSGQWVQPMFIRQ